MFKVILKRLKYNPLADRKKNKRGVALILAVTSLVMMVYIATEVSKDSFVEYIVNSHELNRIKSYYAARNSMQIALLRVKIFQQASRLSLPAGFASKLDQIWQFPFAWPLPISADVNAVDRDTYKQLTQESFMDASYTHDISDEGSKIDINDLASPSKTLQEITKKQLMNIFSQKIDSDENFKQEYQSFQFEDFINHIADWMTDSDSSLSGSDKRSFFAELGTDYPPNRGFRTVDELRLIPGMTEEFFNLLLPRITIYGMKAINPNTASKEVLKSLDPQMTDEAVTEAIARRDNPDKGGPFTGEGEECFKNFKSFVERFANRLTKDFDQIPMICDKVINFRIKATGIFGSGKQAMMSTITAVVIDLNKSATQIRSYVDKEKEKDNPNSPPTDPKKTGQGSSSANQDPLPKGPPRVVYWTEN